MVRRATARRWPTVLAVAPWALLLRGDVTDSMVSALGEILLILPLIYLLDSALRARRASWLLLVTLSMAFFGLRASGVLAPSTVLVGLALTVFAWGAVSGRFVASRLFAVESLGMVGFGAVALIGLALDPDLGRYVIAGGWLAHGLWDLAHLRADRVVQPSFAEWCAVIDILVALQLILL